jgi:hypothetical protein
MVDAVANFAFSAVTTAPSTATTGTSLVITTGDGLKFPAVPFNAIICPTGVQPSTANAEIVRVTAISTDTFTIVRAQESTTARTVIVGDQFFLGITAKMIRDIAGVLPMIMTAQAADPTPPANGFLDVYAKQIAGRHMLKMIGPSGLDTALQPFLARNKVGYWNPPGNSTTTPAVFGFTGYSVVGTTTARYVATTNLFNRMRRLGYVSAATAASFAHARSTLVVSTR